MPALGAATALVQAVCSNAPACHRVLQFMHTSTPLPLQRQAAHPPDPGTRGPAGRALWPSPRLPPAPRWARWARLRLGRVTASRHEAGTPRHAHHAGVVDGTCRRMSAPGCMHAGRQASRQADGRPATAPPRAHTHRKVRVQGGGEGEGLVASVGDLEASVQGLALQGHGVLGLQGGAHSQAGGQE